MEHSKALEIITKRAGNSLMFATKEEVENISPQFEPVVTVLELDKDEFTNVGGGNMYPGKSATNKIADASGVSFIPGVGGTREEGSWSSVKLFKQPVGEKSFWQARGEFKIVGVAQGQRLKPDGTPRFSSVREYEFNPIDRANEDFLKDYQDSGTKYASEISALKHLQEVKKFATQRASTGAQLAVIRELASIPTAFKSGQLFGPDGKAKAMVFSQTIENTRFKVEMAKEIMKTPDGRKAIADAMFGTTKALYGPQAAGQVPPSETIREAERFDEEPEATTSGADDFSLDPDPAPSSSVADPELTRIATGLGEWVAAMALPPEVEAAVQKVLDAGETNLDILRPLLTLVKLLGEGKLSSQAVKTVSETIARGNLDKIILDNLLTKANANAQAFAASKAGAGAT